MKANFYLLMILERICTEAVPVTDLRFTTRKICIKSYFVKLDARAIFYES